MKTTVLALYILCATALLGQSVLGNSVLSSQTQQIQMASHPEHASAQPLAQAQDLREKAGFAYAQGERPLWEVAPKSEEASLGDVARQLKKEHATAKKAQTVWEN
jgi:hypothetical protein